MSMKGVFTDRVMLFLLMVAVVLSQFTIPNKVQASSVDNLALNTKGSGYPNVSAQYTLGGETAWQTVDGIFSYLGSPHNRWTDWSVATASNWLAIDFGQETIFNQVKLYIYNDGGGVKPPANYVIQFGDGTHWTSVTHQTYDPATPAAGLNTVNFDTVTASQVRVVLTHGAAAVGLTEIEVYRNTDVQAAFAVISQIDQLPAQHSVTLSDLTAISAARRAYNNLTAGQQNLVTNLSKLTADETAIAPLLFQDVTLQSAIGNNVGDTVTVKLASVLDTTYSMRADKFQIEVNGVQTAVTNAVYDATDSSLHTIKLTLPTAQLQNAASVALSIQSGAFKMSNQTYNNAISSISVITFTKLDINHDNWIGVDDVTQIIGNPSLQLDVNQDGLFNRADILSILDQISKRIMM